MRKINFEFVLGVVFLLGMTFVSVCFAHLSYSDSGELTELEYILMRVVGFGGTMLFPALLNRYVLDWIEDCEESFYGEEAWDYAEDE